MKKAIFRRADRAHPARGRDTRGADREVCRKNNITEQTFFRWRNKYGGMDVSDARRLKNLEGENARLKKLVAEQALAIDALKEFSRGK
jgi:putative transposase